MSAREITRRQSDEGVARSQAGQLPILAHPTPYFARGLSPAVFSVVHLASLGAAVVVVGVVVAVLLLLGVVLVFLLVVFGPRALGIMSCDQCHTCDMTNCARPEQDAYGQMRPARRHPLRLLHCLA